MDWSTELNIYISRTYTSTFFLCGNKIKNSTDIKHMLFTFQTHFEALGRQFKNAIQVRHLCNRMYVADKNDGLFLASAVHESHSKRITSLSLCYSKPHFLYKKYPGVSVKTVCVPCMHVWYKNKSLRLKKKKEDRVVVLCYLLLWLSSYLFLI